MTIDKSIYDGCLRLTVTGRLDTSTAPLLDSAIEEWSGEAEELLLDCGGLEYISSAGLRVILRAHKLMSGRGGLKLRAVNDSIMEVFDITGFVDILTIE